MKLNLTALSSQVEQMLSGVNGSHNHNQLLLTALSSQVEQMLSGVNGSQNHKRILDTKSIQRENKPAIDKKVRERIISFKDRILSCISWSNFNNTIKTIEVLVKIYKLIINLI